MNELIKISLVILWIIAIYNAIIVFVIKNKSKKIDIKESYIIDLFFSKVNKIPAFIEIMKQYTNYPDIFEDIIYLHKLSIIYNIKSIYDILELNQRINRELQFLSKLGLKINNLNKDWNYIYIKNYLWFYDNDIEKEISKISDDFESFNRLIALKNISILWFLIPIDKKITI